MNDIKTYAVGNGEITLSAQDAEELRIILQTDYLTKVVSEIIDEHSDCFNFSSSASRRHFIDEIVRMNDDIVNLDSSYYAEMLLENILCRAEHHSIKR